MTLRSRFSAPPSDNVLQDATASRRYTADGASSRHGDAGQFAPRSRVATDLFVSGRVHDRRWFPLNDDAHSRLGVERITKLLVIDDNVDVRFAMYEFLTAEGYDVAVAGDGLQGVALARMTQPHAILLDLGMPALDGFSTARALRGMAAFAQTPMIAVTGYFDKSHFDDARASGFDYYFQKPVEIEALLDLLRSRGPANPS